MYSIAAHLSAFSCLASFVAKVPEVFFGEQEAKAVSERGKEEGGALVASDSCRMPAI